MENNQRNSRKKLNSLILLVAFTAVMLIVSTYAWFSTQRNVVLSGLKGKVNVAEGLQISLDAEHWVNTINFEDFLQTDPTNWTVKSNVTTTYLGQDKTFQNPTDGVKNVVPTEFLPVSTTAETNEGIGLTGLKLYAGQYGSDGLKDIKEMPEEASSGYFAFDLFLMNTSKTGIVSDKLQLDSNSDVTGVNEATGIQNTVRVGIALYENGEVGGDGTHPMVIGKNPAQTPQEIIAGTSTSKKITDVAIWEPNADKHVENIVNSAANSLKLSSTDQTTYGITPNGAGIAKFTDGKVLPTYAVTATTKEAGTIGDVYDWATPATGLKKQNVTATKDETRIASIDLHSVKDGTTPIEIIANQYQKMRVYVWIDGQDPDCINYASLGQGLTIDLGFSKPETETSSSAE